MVQLKLRSRIREQNRSRIRKHSRIRYSSVSEFATSRSDLSVFGLLNNYFYVESYKVIVKLRSYIYVSGL